MRVKKLDGKAMELVQDWRGINKMKPYTLLTKLWLCYRTNISKLTGELMLYPNIQLKGKSEFI